MKKEKHKPSRELFANEKRLIHPPYIIADEIRTPENYGHIIRLGANMGCSKVFFIRKDGDIRLSKVAKTADSSHGIVSWEIVESINEIISHIPDDYTWLSIETHERSLNIYETTLPDKVVFIIGNESQGVTSELLTRSNLICHIPIPGPTSSLNVSHALSVALFEWYRQHYQG